MMQGLGKRLQGSRRVQKVAIPAITSIAQQIQDGFTPYFGPLMPILKSLIGQIAHKPEERELLGKAFECISMLAKAVGPVLFKPEAVEIMQAMIQATQVPNLPAEDPVKEYMLSSAERICITMKSEFLPFVPHILPGIFEKLAAKPEEICATTFVEDNGEREINVVQINGETKIMAMSTSAAEDLENALSCIKTFVTELGMHYVDFIPQTAQNLIPVFDLGMSEEVRDLAFDVWGELLNSAKLAGRQPIVSELCREFLKRTLPQMTVRDADGDVLVDTLKTRADGVSTCLKKAGPNVLGVEEVRHINGVLTQLLGQSFERREAARMKKQQKKKAPKAPEEDEESNDNAEEDE